MLSTAQRAIVSATVPLLELGGEALITHFYQTMLADYPEVRPYFNASHQASGDQPRALANGVLMYAKNIDRLEALGPLATQIVNKHVALQIQPEHYPIVGSCLLQAIREVLGAKVATEEVIAAWAAAYGQLADLLIGAEKARYDTQAAAPGGWRGDRAFTVERKVQESSEIVSFYLVPADGGAPMNFQPGQYIGLHLWVDGEELRRNYSLSAAPNGRSYRISVKREPGGAVSNFLHDRVREGDTLQLNAPSGAFVVVASDRPVVLISGGVGITPTLPMLEQVLETGRPVIFIHCARNPSVHAFGTTIAAAATQHPQLVHHVCYESSSDSAGNSAVQSAASGYLDVNRLRAWLPAAQDNGVCDVDVYFLGPKPFMRAVRRYLLEVGVPEVQSHWEFFGPASALT